MSVLRERYGMDDASPFSYVSGLSPFLNVYCEPPQYLDAEERRVFEPVAFFGSLPPLEELDRGGGHDRRSVFGGEGRALNVYVSFGTVAWRYYRDEAIDALRALSRSLAAKPDVRAVISLGRADVPPDVVGAQPLEPDAKVGLEAPGLEIEVGDVGEVGADVDAVRGLRRGERRGEKEQRGGQRGEPHEPTMPQEASRPKRHGETPP